VAFRWEPNGVSRGTGVVFREACLAFGLTEAAGARVEKLPD